MDYELALELKNAGFPQKNPLAIPKGSAIHHENGNLELPNEPVYLPTLSELIEACGEDFLHLERFGDGTWVAAGDGEPLEQKEAEGSTPEEAVAKLWLDLNKPN